MKNNEKNIFNIEGFIKSSVVKKSQKGKEYLLGTLRMSNQDINFTCFKHEAFKVLSDYQGSKLLLSGKISTFRNNIQLIVNGAKDI